MDARPAPLEGTLEVQVLDGDTGPKEYYLLGWKGDPHALPLATVAESADAAVEEFLLPDLAATEPWPPWRDGQPVHPPGHVPELLLAVTRDGRAYVVAEADLALRGATQGALWDRFTTVEIAHFLRRWCYLKRLR